MKDMFEEVFLNRFANKPKIPKGILIGCDANLEWMLPWWWYNFSTYNSLPVAFVDFGLSDKGKAWCKSHGILISLNAPEKFVAEKNQVDPSLIKKWESMITSSFWSDRKIWFQKPLAMIKTPFQKTL